MNEIKYLEERIKIFEEKISMILECKAKEMDKSYDQRNYKLLYMYHKDEAMYSLCLKEFKLLKEKFV